MQTMIKALLWSNVCILIVYVIPRKKKQPICIAAFSSMETSLKAHETDSSDDSSKPFQTLLKDSVFFLSSWLERAKNVSLSNDTRYCLLFALTLTSWMRVSSITSVEKTTCRFKQKASNDLGQNFSKNSAVVDQAILVLPTIKLLAIEDRNCLLWSIASGFCTMTMVNGTDI